MGTEIGEFSESTFLYEAACNPDPVLRLTGVNRALEGLAIDVFNTMREFGDDRRRPGARVLRGLDARRRGHPREDGLRLAAPPHRERPASARSGPSSSSGSSTSCSASAASAARRTTARSAWPAASASWPASTPTRWTSSPRSPSEAREEMEARVEADRAAVAATRSADAGRGPARRRSRWSTSTPPRSGPSSRSWSARSACPATSTVAVEVDETHAAGPGRGRVDRPGACITVGVRRPRGPEARRGSSSAAGAADVLGRLLFRVRDRLDPAFGDAARRRRPHARSSRRRGTSTASAGSAGSATRSQRQRRLYHFRNRHGFTDAADAAFDAPLGRPTDLTWADIEPPSSERRPAPRQPRRPSRLRSGRGREIGVEQVDLRWAARAGRRRPRPSRPCRRSRSGPAGPRATPTSAMITKRFGCVADMAQVDVAAARVAAAEHDVLGQDRLQPLGVGGVEGHRDDRELDLVGSGSGAIACIPPDQGDP